ncbi:uncharacterized protein LOC115634490 [Scaptodrosophila lebanonensis]|uniref:Uncharacterized protein LOC115634301 n=1 Tax=Drosophila lebanonensis TaxID=7225 RepID=A0A6J2UIL0_DROLE|nr:uncharacterized protein LOC115634301 [Scaptodrosophila lebanonensis]XP_030388069.1 uncharacterized protein LOC115634478 [Scaptodrosophila lebanonensis]XP_030388105.1 uncharacterized protein LOC115634488 [Scaptodrosophila lebanonensis]XP_030388107.1 uncharacterized protein LOC115634490 [Scaptodrosophila lebanonensis]
MNFQGANTELQQVMETLDAGKIAEKFTGPRMKWKFLPPASPHMGGTWERLAALMEVQMIVHSRPLTYIPVDDENEEALTPNHFLLGSSNGQKPEVQTQPEGILMKNN